MTLMNQPNPGEELFSAAFKEGVGTGPANEVLTEELSG